MIFVALGLLTRRQPSCHRAMMLLATMTFLPATTTRMPTLLALFGDEGWWAFNSSIVVFGVVVLIVRLIMDRAIDRWFAAGFAGLMCLMMVNQHLAVGESWGRVAKWILED